jgi:CheY-like chemotaxis protein
MTPNSGSRAVARGTVLCIDDSPEVLGFQRALLEHSGYEVLLASNGADGIKLAKSCAIDVALLDYEMPHMLGTEVARGLREMQPALPIILISGASLPAESVEVADCCLSKIEMGSTLVPEIDRLLLSRSGRTLA